MTLSEEQLAAWPNRKTQCCSLARSGHQDFEAGNMKGRSADIAKPLVPKPKYHFRPKYHFETPANQKQQMLTICSGGDSKVDPRQRSSGTIYN